MKTLGEILKLSTTFLEEKKALRPRKTAEALIGSLLGLKRMDLYMQFDLPLEEKELETLRGLLKRVLLDEPLEYILGQIDFFGSKIKVDQRALIPRIETELLVEQVAKEISTQKTVWDLCTGTGCIGISLKKTHPGIDVFLSDVSADALALAKENALQNDVHVTLIQGDFLVPFKGKKADIIVCNPPYIETEKIPFLDLSVKGYEPELALDGGGDGLKFYKTLASYGHEYLNPGGKLYLEIGFNQGKEVEKLFSRANWKRGELRQDLSGKDRFFFLENQ